MPEQNTNIALEIARIQTDRNTIRTKLVELGLATTTDGLDTLAAAVAGIENKGAVSATVQEGDTFTIPKGYHNGSGTVSGVSGGGNYSLQSKEITPTKSQQNVTPDAGYYGLSDVTVKAIPENYQDVSSTTLDPASALSGKIFVDASGKVQTGTMANNGAVSKTLDGTAPSYTVPKGYHDGTGVVKITPESKTTTPTKLAQDITPTTGKVLTKVTVEPIPAAYQDVTGVTTSAPNVLDGDFFVAADGTLTEGTMANNGAVNKTLDTTTTTYTIAPGYHDGTGVIKIVPETKSVTPTKAAQDITPAAGKVLSKVSVAAIPAAYQDVTGVTTTAAHVLDGDFFVDATGAKIEGTMANNGSSDKTIDGMSVTSVVIPAGFTTGGTVALTNDIELALKAI